MVEIKFTASAENVKRINDAFERTYQIPQDSDGIPEYSNSAWTKKKIIDYVKNIVRKFETKIAQSQLNISTDGLID